MIILSIIAGVLTGAVSFVPLFLCFSASKKVSKTSNMGYLGLMLIGVSVSILILFTCVILCYFIGNENVLSFTLACSISLCVIAVCFGVYTSISRDRASNQRKEKKGK